MQDWVVKLQRLKEYMGWVFGMKCLVYEIGFKSNMINSVSHERRDYLDLSIEFGSIEWKTLCDCNPLNDANM